MLIYPKRDVLLKLWQHLGPGPPAFTSDKQHTIPMAGILPEYEYAPLQDGEIRLLYSENLDEEVFWSLRIVQLDDIQDQPVAYDALSYTWGDLTHTFPFRCSNKLLRIHRNLLDALPMLARRRSSLPAWIDAVCINQSDEAEKFVQIGMMHRVYRQARQVWVCLRCNVSSDTAKEAASLVPRIVELGKELKGKSVGAFRFGSEANALTSRTSASNGLPPFSAAVWTGVQELVRNEWFYRLWIVQEAALARQITVLYGSLQIDWEIVRGAVDWGFWIWKYMRDPDGGQAFAEGLLTKKTQRLYESDTRLKTNS